MGDPVSEEIKIGNAVIRRRNLTEYKQDHANANKGTERGYRMLDDSIRESGMGRSIVAAADDSLPAGNKTWENAIDAGITDAIEVETDGHQVVVVKRRDWQSVDDPKARKYAYQDNRVGEISLAWDAEQLLKDIGAGIDISAMFRDDEIAALIQDTALNTFTLSDISDLGSPIGHDDTDTPPVPREKTAHFPLAIVLSAADLRRWQGIKTRVGYMDDTRAFLAVLEHLEGDQED